MSVNLPPICIACSRYKPGISDPDFVSRCAAFPQGIPTEILKDMWDHREPLLDETILFDLRDGAEKLLAEWESARAFDRETEFAAALGPEIEETE